MNSPFKILATLSFFFLFAFSVQAKKYSLKLNLQQGVTYHQVSNVQTDMTQSFNGKDINILMQVEGNTSFKVLAKQADNYSLEAKMVNLKLTMKLGGREMVFSSENTNANDAFSKIFKEIVNKPFKVTMNNYGKISKINGLSKMWDDIINKFSHMNEQQKQQIIQQINQTYGEKAFKGNFEMATAIFPQHSVKIGDSWKIDNDLQTGISAKMSTEYKLSEINANTATFTGESAIKTSPKDNQLKTNIRYNLSGNSVSKIVIDRKTGWIIKATHNQYIKGETEMGGSGQVPNVMKIPIILKTVTTITNK